VKEFKKHRADIKKVVGAKQCDNLTKVFKKGSRTSIGAEEWTDIVFAFVKASNIPPVKRAKLLHPLFLDRFMSVYKKYLDKDNRMLENEVVKQAELFYKDRQVLITK